MKTYFLLLCCMLPAAIVHAQQTCNSNMPASTPDSQLIDNGNGTVTDSTTGLMWKQCVEGASGNNCETGSPSTFTWQEALQQPRVVNNSGGFAGHADWRLPNINELVSLVEEQCSYPAINLNRFPNTPSSVVRSGSPFAGLSDGGAWYVNFSSGYSFSNAPYNDYAVRLVRGGQ